MPRRTETVVVGELTFEVTQFPFQRAHDIWLEMLRAWGPALMGVVSAGADSATPVAAMDKLVKVVPTVFAYADTRQTSQLLNSLLGCVQVSGAKGVSPCSKEVLEAAFTGDIWGYYELVAKAMDVNYRSFFEGAAKRIAPLLAAAFPSASRTASAETGPFGVSSSTASPAGMS